MNHLDSLFQNLKALTRYAPGADGVTSLADMEAAALTAHKRVCSVITTQVYNINVGATPECVVIEPLRQAMANMTLSVQLTFDTVNRRKNGADIYKYELEAMRRAYMENYYNAMDTLIGDITACQEDSDDTTEAQIAAAWQNSRYQQLLMACQVKTADDFDVIYSIDASQLFFFRTLPIQKEIIDARLGVYFDKLQDNDRVASMLRLALCKKVVAAALRRFDILECPATIRNLFDESTVSGQRKDERGSALSLADLLDSEADTLISDIDMLLTADGVTDISSWSAYNQPDDNIVMMP